MGANYGVSFATKLINDGKFEEALAAADEAHKGDAEDPEPFLDRGIALTALERYVEAVGDFERALALDEDSGTLEIDLVDDSVFAALLGEARRTTDVSAAVAMLERYGKILPRGRHLVDVTTWSGRLRGEGKNDPIIKEQ